MFTVGLTGGIGSGKSTVAALFAEFNVPVIDTDTIAHELTARGGAVLGAIREAFGESVMQPDGSLDRAALRRLVFADAAVRQQLEAILHPVIREAVAQRLAALSAPYAIVVIPLLVETGAYRDVLNRVLVVDCPEGMQIERAMARSGLAREEVEVILAAQARRGERLAIADDVVENTAALAALREKVETLHRRYQALAAAGSP